MTPVLVLHHFCDVTSVTAGHSNGTNPGVMQDKLGLNVQKQLRLNHLSSRYASDPEDRAAMCCDQTCVTIAMLTAAVQGLLVLSWCPGGCGRCW